MTATGKRLSDQAGAIVDDGDGSLDLGRWREAAPPALAALAGSSVLVRTRTQREAADALVTLDGLVARLTLAPPDLRDDQLAAVCTDAAVEAIVGKGDETGAVPSVADWPGRVAVSRPHETEWVMLTSGTAGRPKLVAHTLAGLTDAIGAIRTAGDTPVRWATFYDIRRFGGLQILLRAILGGHTLHLSRAGESADDHLRRLGSAAVTHISGTPSHWRRALLSTEHERLAPRYIRLSGETADQVVLDALRRAYPDAAIGHAYASTEAGVAFAVDDGLAGFPATFLEDSNAPVALRVADDTLRIRSRRTATRYLGDGAPVLHDADGFVDTGDLVERRGDRFHFTGRRNGIINVGGLKVNPEEVEAALNGHPDVDLSLVKAKRNPLLGAIVAADVLPRPGAEPGRALQDAVLAHCRAVLAPHKVPAVVRFVSSLPLTAAGKLSRGGGSESDA